MGSDARRSSRRPALRVLVTGVKSPLLRLGHLVRLRLPTRERCSRSCAAARLVDPPPVCRQPAPARRRHAGDRRARDQACSPRRKAARPTAAVRLDPNGSVAPPSVSPVCSASAASPGRGAARSTCRGRSRSTPVEVLTEALGGDLTPCSAARAAAGRRVYVEGQWVGLVERSSETCSSTAWRRSGRRSSTAIAGANSACRDPGATAIDVARARRASEGPRRPRAGEELHRAGTRTRLQPSRGRSAAIDPGGRDVAMFAARWRPPAGARRRGAAEGGTESPRVRAGRFRTSRAFARALAASPGLPRPGDEPRRRARRGARDHRRSVDDAALGAPRRASGHCPAGAGDRRRALQPYRRGHGAGPARVPARARRLGWLLTEAHLDDAAHPRAEAVPPRTMAQVSTLSSGSRGRAGAPARPRCARESRRGRRGRATRTRRSRALGRRSRGGRHVVSRGANTPAIGEARWRQASAFIRLAYRDVRPRCACCRRCAGRAAAYQQAGRKGGRLRRARRLPPRDDRRAHREPPGVDRSDDAPVASGRSPPLGAAAPLRRNGRGGSTHPRARDHRGTRERRQAPARRGAVRFGHRHRSRRSAAARQFVDARLRATCGSTRALAAVRWAGINKADDSPAAVGEDTRLTTDGGASPTPATHGSSVHRDAPAAHRPVASAGRETCSGPARGRGRVRFCSGWSSGS